MKSFVVGLIGFALVMIVGCDCFGQSCSGQAAQSCSGRKAFGTPVRNVIASRPIASTLAKICNAAKARGCSGAKASCAGSKSSCAGPVSCAGAMVVPSAPYPVATSQEQVVQSGRYVSSVAQAKSNQQAQEGQMRHVGGSMGSGTHEGVGFSTRSAEDAIRQCCYWGKRTPVDIGVQRGQDGYYATVLYQ